MPVYGITKGLPRSVDVLQPEHPEVDALGPAPRRQHVLLGELGRGIDAGRRGNGAIGLMRNECQRFSRRTLRIPSTRSQLTMGAADRQVDRAIFRLPLALAVDRPATGQDNPLRQMSSPGKRVEHGGRTNDIRHRMAAGFVKALTRACLCR